MKQFYRKSVDFIPFIIAISFYFFTLAPSVVQIDSGELAAVQATAGIAHPTGYPLFTMIGYLFLLLPLPFTKILSLNVLAALFCGFAVFFFSKSLRIILNNFPVSFPKSASKKQNSVSVFFETTDLVKEVIIISGSLFLAFGKTFWFQSTSVEVYSLHLLLMNILIFLLVKVLFSQDVNASSKKTWFVLAFVLALAFSNHLTTILLIPGIAFIFFSKNKFSRMSFSLLIKMFLIFLPVLILIYLYLPLRASFSPSLNWGNPVTLENFWRHFRGAQYSPWFFSSFESAKKQFIYFITNLPDEFTYVGLALIITGIIYSFRRVKKLFYFLSLTALTTIAYSINYDIVDIDSYFLLAYIMFAFFLSIALILIFHHLQKKINKNYLITAVLLSCFYLAWSNYKNVDQSENYIFEDYTKGILSSVEPGSVIFSYQWDYFISASYYFQLAENFRNDVKVIDKELLRRSWYYDQLKNNHPEMIRGQEKNISTFLDALKPFEHGGNFNPQILEEYYQKIMTGLVSDNMEKYNYFIGIELLQNEIQNGQFKLPEGYTIVPHLFLFKVVKTNNYVSAPDPDFILRRPKAGNKYTDFIETTLYSMLTYRALYEMNYNKPERAKKYVDKIKSLFPEKPIHKSLSAY